MCFLHHDHMQIFSFLQEEACIAFQKEKQKKWEYLIPVSYEHQFWTDPWPFDLAKLLRNIGITALHQDVENNYKWFLWQNNGKRWLTNWLRAQCMILKRLVVYDICMPHPAWAALFKAQFIDIWYIYIYRSHNLVYKIYCRNRPRAKTSLDCPSIQATRFKIPVWLLIFFSGCIHSFRVYLVSAVLITSIPKSTSSLVIHIGGLIRNTCKVKKNQISLKDP